MYKIMAIIVASSVCIGVAGCSSRGLYEGMREVERQNCYKMENLSERQACLERVDETSYDQYQRERAGLKEH